MMVTKMFPATITFNI